MVLKEKLINYANDPHVAQAHFLIVKLTTSYYLTKQHGITR